jgi:hypothetical protein
LHVAEVLEVARVGELVEIHDRVAGMARQDVTDEVGADEAGAPGDEELQLVSLSPLGRGPGEGVIPG